MRTVIANSEIEKYLDNLVEQGTFSYGIIIGQPSKSLDYVIHLARTPHDAADTDSDSETSIVTHASNVESISVPLLVDHAITAIRMIPGSLYVLGIYIFGGVDIFADELEFEKVKSIAKDLAAVLRDNKSIFACTDEFDGGEKLILYYDNQRKFKCKSVQVTKTEEGIPQEQAVDWQLHDLHTFWQQIETVYDITNTFPLIKRPHKPFNLEENICFTVDYISRRLESSLVFIDGEFFNATSDMECILKTLQILKNDESILQGSIYFPCKEKIDEEESTIIRYDGTMRYSGIIYSKIWVHTKCEFKNIEKFIKADILRSIWCRLRLYLDTTTCIESQHDLEYVMVTDPPRRVFFEFAPLPILFSDYIFRGETEDTVVAQAKDILDIDIQAENVLCDIETIPDNDDDITDNNKNLTTRDENNTRSLYIFGILLSLGVLFISIGYHFAFNYD